MTMDCDLCTEKATIYLSQVADGQVQKVNLCKACADEQGVTDPTGFALAEMLEGMGKQETIRPAAAADGDELTCPSCRFTQSEFKKSGRFGCSECYHTFDQGLDTLLEAMHKRTQHVGKTPASFPQLPASDYEPGLPGPSMAPSPADKLSELKAELSKAVEDEDYEKAAQVRDEISRLEIQAGGS